MTNQTINLGPARPAGPVNWDRIEAHYKKAEELFQYDLGWVPTREEAATLIREVRDIYSGPEERSVTKVIRYFAEFCRFYPWVDWVVVRRAADFHWEVWPDMTDREWDHTIDRLATMYDPWEEDGFDTVASKSGDGADYIPRTPRAKRWAMLRDTTERKSLHSTVDRRRRALRGKA